MRTWQCGAIGIGLLTVACGGGGDAGVSGGGAYAQQSAGAEVRRPTEIVEVDEAQLPSVSRGDIAQAEPAATPSLPITSREGAETERAPETWAAERSMTSRPGETQAPETEALPPSGRETEETHAMEMPRAEGGVGTEAEVGLEGEAGVAGVGAEGEVGEVAQAPSFDEEPLQVTIDEICPADIESLRVQARNVPNGAAIVLTASRQEDIDEVRNRMRELALVHSMEHAQQCDLEQHGVVESVSAQPARHRIADPASPLFRVHEIRLVEIANGVRVELRFDEHGDRQSVRDLRAAVRQDAASLADGVCPLSFQMT